MVCLPVWQGIIVICFEKQLCLAIQISKVNPNIFRDIKSILIPVVVYVPNPTKRICHSILITVPIFILIREIPGNKKGYLSGLPLFYFPVSSNSICSNDFCLVSGSFASI